MCFEAAPETGIYTGFHGSWALWQVQTGQHQLIALLCWFSYLVSWVIANLHGKISSLFQAQHRQLKKCRIGAISEDPGKYFVPWAQYWLISSSLLSPSPCPALSWLLHVGRQCSREKAYQCDDHSVRPKALSVLQVMCGNAFVCLPGQRREMCILPGEWKFWKLPFFIL